MTLTAVADVALRHVTRRYGDVLAVDDLSLEIEAGQFVTLLGPSGCGKTTTLRMIGGFDHPDSGEIAIRGAAMGTRPPHLRPTAMVFQSYALFPHMTVADNVAFGLREREVGRQERDRRVAAMLALVELEGFGARRPRELSGGQQQRVALARALVVEPTVLLLDEPLGALDLRLRRAMQVQLKEIQRRTGITFIYVTHDQDEALTMSDRIVIMNAGRIEQAGSAIDVYDRPRTRFAATFMGARNLLATRVEQETVHIGPHALSVVAPDGAATVMIRPEHIRLTDDTDGWPATVVASAYQGAQWSVRARLEDGTELAISVPRNGVPAPETGACVRLAVRPEHAWIIPEDHHPDMEAGAR
ncbi:MAG TPA: ABC transporter ATP-binding protein [Thermomicrobiales bacterium]|nr:ABC transporter ATP-binding protein [Thermomicrobiales bacterium]